MKIFVTTNGNDQQEIDVPFKTDKVLIKSDFPELAKLDLVRVKNTFNTIQYKVCIVEKRSGFIVSSSSDIYDAYFKARNQFKMAKKWGVLQEMNDKIIANGGELYDESTFDLL